MELDDEKMSTLDRFEPGSDRSLVGVALSGLDDQCVADTYLARRAAVDPSNLPFAWYRRLVVAGGTARGLPEEYLAGIAARPARKDGQRHAAGGAC